jgi:methyl-accepting chemotaxis protein
VDQAAAKVRDMVGLLKVVGDYAMKDRETSVALVRVSEKSQAAIDDTFARVAAMAESVSSIMEIANVISDIAMQTNMLAMNASIEAAHAGEFGRGFSVVASEISKLASASATSSEEIARNIKAVVTRINETTLSREQSQVALDAIKGQIDQVAESSRAIFESVQSLQAGSGQIIGSMEVLRAGSAEQRQRFSGIGGSTGQITASVGELERISSEVVSNIGEITAGLEEIRNSVDSTAAAAELVGTISDDLTASVGRFRTRDAKAPD